MSYYFEHVPDAHMDQQSGGATYQSSFGESEQHGCQVAGLSSSDEYEEHRCQVPD